MKIRSVVTVKGIVQGVSFRRHTLEKAEKLKVCGWVKNLPNGQVLGCFEGEKEDVDALVAWCGIGPSTAQVDEVISRREEYRGEFRDFHISF
ncbi:MAG: hypothetical protein FD174_2182 [Geobacteraceae bacterium]|nr:MAG: hypothetical protein FD174_2182 [Geobacteraceae bacterium]